METVNYLLEEWRDIPGYEGLYQASSLGMIRSVERLVPGKKGFFKLMKSVVLKQTTAGRGYASVMLSKNGVTKRWNVHRLIALTFIPNPNNLPEVNHKDENKTNNIWANLEWCDSKYNANYGHRNINQVNTKLKKKGAIASPL